MSNIKAMPNPTSPKVKPQSPAATDTKPDKPAPDKSKEIGGPAGPEPTRYGDWERGGRCIDF